MNVLGKIKSKKPKPDQNPKETQTFQIQQKKIYQIKSQDHRQQPLQTNLSINTEERSEIIKKPRLTKPVLDEEFITNTNVISRQKQKSLKQYDSELIRTTNSISNSFTSVFETKKQSKKAGVYFEEIPFIRNNSINSNQNSNDRSKISNQEQSIINDDQFSFDFDFLLSQKQKKQIKKSLNLSRGKAQNVNQIEEELKRQNKEVLSFFIRKWNLYGDIYMFEGELQSLKKRYIEVQSEQGKVKSYDRIKVKLSCGRQMIVGPQTIGRIFVSDVVFLSQNQAMIPPQYLLKTIDKSKKRGRNS